MRLKKQPDTKTRNRLLAAIGAVVILAALTYAVGGFPSQNAGITSIRGNEAVPAESDRYPVHSGIPTTVFWVGEEADPHTNDNIHNISSAWVVDWEASFGGVDDPSDRCGYKPCGFEPKENPFYFALPFFEYTEQGLKPASELEVIPWYDGRLEPGGSIIKNRWIEIEHNGKKAYAQWQDAGPFGEGDARYVFGTDRPSEPRAGLDVSPAVASYLGIDGKADTSWRFVDESAVPPGPWTETITTSGPQW